MCDHACHGTPILAGMWGVRNGLLSHMCALIESYGDADHWESDQEFLARHIAPIVCERWIEHDELLARRAYPGRPPWARYVGEPFDERGRSLLPLSFAEKVRGISAHYAARVMPAIGETREAYLQRKFGVGNARRLRRIKRALWGPSS